MSSVVEYLWELRNAKEEIDGDKKTDEQTESHNLTLTQLCIFSLMIIER